jgi:hypothetical protein
MDSARAAVEGRPTNDHPHFLKKKRGIDHGTSRRVIEVAGRECVAARIAAEHRGRFGRRDTQHAGAEYRLGCPAGSVYRLLPVVSHQEEAEPMHGSLPGVQRQHQPPLWKLWKLRLLSDVGGLLQRDMHGPEFGSAQLWRLRICLSRICADL